MCASDGLIFSAEEGIDTETLDAGEPRCTTSLPPLSLSVTLPPPLTDTPFSLPATKLSPVGSLIVNEVSLGAPFPPAASLKLTVGCRLASPAIEPPEIAGGLVF